MPIWTQEQLYDQIVNGYNQCKSAEGKAKQEDIQNGINQLEHMETWLDKPFRDQLDEYLNTYILKE